MLAMLTFKEIASLLILIAAIFSCPATFCTASNLTWEAERLLAFKQGLTQADVSLSEWSSANLPRVCDSWQGVTCSDTNATVIGLNFTSFNVSGQLTPPLCDLPNLAQLQIRNNSINQTFPGFLIQSCRELTVLDFSLNSFYGPLPVNISANLSKLQQFNMESNYFEGEIPVDLSNLSQLTLLRLRGNLLSGPIPPELGRLSLLQVLDLSYNPYIPQEIPHELGNLSSLQHLDLPGCGLVGEIPASFGTFLHLAFLDLSQNNLSGTIPSSLANLFNLSELYLWENNLSGPLPPLSKLSRLTIAQFQSNSLSGTIPAGFASLSSLKQLHLDGGNNLSGSLPDGLASLPALSTFTVGDNSLSGNLSSQWGLNSALVQFDVTNNSFTGSFPPHLCTGNRLQYLSLKNNRISGEIPVEYGNCKSVLRFVVDGNQLSGSVPSGLWMLPSLQVLILRKNNLSGKIMLSNSERYGSLQTVFLESNQFEGPIPSQIGEFWFNLSKLTAAQNRLSGPLPLQIGSLSQLEVLDLSANLISGEIPPSIGDCGSLTSLFLSQNNLSGPIPPELSQIPNLNYLNLSWNSLNGSIPSSLAKSTYSIFDVAYNDLSGLVPEPLASDFNSSMFEGNPQLCYSQSCNLLKDSKDGKRSIKLMVLIMVLGVCAVLLCAALMVRMHRKRSKARREVANDWTVVSFQRLEFNEEELYESLEEKNVIGSGGSGRVYKVLLEEAGGGKTVAVKKLTPSSTMNGRGFPAMVNRRDESSAFKAEMEILGKIKHRNIVSLLCSCASKEAKLLVYEYMCNGSLGDVLHKAFRTELLCWATRFKIALGAAEGLAYLHHDCAPPILHRDVKSNNILLDSSFQAKLADFGVAKSFQNNASMTAVVGSFGYIAPEYAYTMKVDEKSDVYSYGVVLLELVTGRRPTSKDLECEGIDLVRWVGQQAQSKEGLSKVLDCRLEVGDSDKESIYNVLKLALICTSTFPRQRPSMREVVELLHRATPTSILVSHQHDVPF
eukprot:c25314_g1_i1 orf=414-3425(-)